MTTPVTGLPAEIAAAIETYWKVAVAWARTPSDVKGTNVRVVEDALNSVILARLTAVEAQRNEYSEYIIDLEFEATRTKAALSAALAGAERAEKAIRDFLSGDYPNPRQHRPGQCKHGVYYWEECGGCDCEHFEAALAQPATAEET